MKMKVASQWAIVAAAGLALSILLFNSKPSTDVVSGKRLGPEGPFAFETQYGLIITDTEEKASWAKGRLKLAASKFIDVFGVPPKNGVIVDLSYASYTRTIPQSQRKWTLPWMSQYFGSGESDNSGLAGHHFDNDSAILHELNHVFFTATIFPNTKKPQYGSDAPDWLDEAVALAAESAAVKKTRREHFYTQVCANRLVPLGHFLTQPHPLFQSPEMKELLAKRREAADGNPAMVTMRLDQLNVSRDAMMDFYSQANAVAEFFVESSKDPRVLGTISRALIRADGSTKKTDYQLIEEIVGSGATSLESRFAAWAHSAAAASVPNCSEQARGI
jgi:hypothetical protein